MVNQHHCQMWLVVGCIPHVGYAHVPRFKIKANVNAWLLFPALARIVQLFVNPNGV